MLRAGGTKFAGLEVHQSVSSRQIASGPNLGCSVYISIYHYTRRHTYRYTYVYICIAHAHTKQHIIHIYIYIYIYTHIRHAYVYVQHIFTRTTTQQSTIIHNPFIHICISTLEIASNRMRHEKDASSQLGGGAEKRQHLAPETLVSIARPFHKLFRVSNEMRGQQTT